MTDDVLGQAEVESLLGTTESSTTASAHNEDIRPAAAWESSGRKGREVQSQERVTPYDFKQPERVGKNQMQAIQSLHEDCGKNFGASLSDVLRNVVEVKLNSVDQLTYSEFIFSLENPSCFNLLAAQPLEGNLILEINPSILYPIIDRLLGGGKETGPLDRRPLTEIELRLVRRITDLFLRELKNAWKNVVELDLSVERVESNPKLIQIVPPNEIVVLIRFEMTIGDIRGMMNLCIPLNSLETIEGKLTSNTWAGSDCQEPSQQSRDSISRQLCGSAVEVIVQLAQSKIRTADLLGLRVGDIITTDQDCHGVLPVSVEGIPKFFAKPGAFKGHKAFQVEQRVALPPAADG